MQTEELGRWRRLEALLDQALDLEPGQRAEWLQQACPDPATRQRIEAMLADAEADSGPLEALAARILPTAVDDDLAGTELGGCRLISLLGEGGMATVWRAERGVSGSVQPVAVKCLRQGLIDPEARRRFIEEQAILARLNHPHITRLFDSGLAPDGRPFIVMELVDGLPLIEHADADRLDTAARITLFLKVVEALAHAHGELVVHRDLKPANILVDRHGEPRLLDFGIARLLSPGHAAADPTLLRPLTPEYASPEQLQGRPVGVRSDIYSLGLVLHELLSGQRASGTAEERERSRPSTALRRSERAEALAAARRRSLPRLLRELRGDLDLIVQKCLRQDSLQRYASANALAEDLRRWQQLRPLLARQGDRRYRLRRFLQRHWLALAAGATVLLSMWTGTLVAWEQARRATAATVQALQAQARAQQEAERAGATSRFLVDLFRAQLPGLAPDELPSTRQVLDRGLERSRDPDSGSPALRADLMVSLAEILLARRQFDEARALQQEAATLAGGPDGGHPETWSRLLHLHADILRAQRRYDELEIALEEAIAFVEGNLPEGPPLFELLRERGMLDMSLERFESAEARFQALHQRIQGRSGLGNLPLRLATDRANALGRLGNLREAMEQHEQILRLKREDPATTTLSIAVTVFNLGSAALTLGELEDARLRLDEVLDSLDEIPSPIQVRAAAMHSHSRLARWFGDYELAHGWLQRSAEEWARVLGMADPQQDSFIHYHGAELLAEEGRLEDAIAAAGRAVERMQALADSPPARIGRMQALQVILRCQLAGARDQPETLLEHLSDAVDADDRTEAEASCALAQGRAAAAAELILPLQVRLTGPDRDFNLRRMQRQTLLAEILAANGDRAGAQRLATSLNQRLDHVGALPGHPLRMRLRALQP